MLTILPRAVSGAIPTSRLLNSAHFIPSPNSFDKRSPYCDWKDDTIRSKSSMRS